MKTALTFIGLKILEIGIPVGMVWGLGRFCKWIGWAHQSESTMAIGGIAMMVLVLILCVGVLGWVFIDANWQLAKKLTHKS